MTGLPIDFQIDQQSHANRVHEKKPRNTLGLHAYFRHQQRYAIAPAAATEEADAP